MSRSSLGHTSTSGASSRSGIGLNADEWSAPTRLNSSSLAIKPREDDDDDDDTRSVTSAASSSTTVLTSRAMQRAGFLVEEDSGDRRHMYDAAEDDEAFDRDFYLADEGQAVADERASEPFLGNPLKFQAREEQMSRARAKGDAKVVGVSARRSQLLADQEAWEDNRLLQSGVAVSAEVRTEFAEEEDARVSLIVHQIKPPFLDGRVSFSMQQSTVSTVKDPSADMATNARKGSDLLRSVRDRKDKMKMRARFWELGGSKIGDAMGIARPEEEQERGAEAQQVGGAEEEDVDYREGSSFAKHVKKNEAQSAFSLNKSLAEQREYLPVFSVKQELINVIRENQVTVIVGRHIHL